MKLWRLALVLIAALVAVGMVSKGFCRLNAVTVVAEDSSSTDDGGDDAITEFA